MPLSNSDSSLFQAALEQHKAGHLAEAEKLYQQSFQQEPHRGDSLYMLGLIAKQTKKPTLALDLLRKALGIRPRPEIYCEIGLLLKQARRPFEALQNFENALELKPDYVEAAFLKGTLLLEQGFCEESSACLSKALSLKPNHTNIANGLGLALIATGKADQALSLFRQLIAHRPDQFVFHANLTVALLMLGRFDEGFKEYQWRWALDAYKAAYPLPLWQSEEIRGKTLLIHGEHGFGDAIQFCRYASLAAERGIKTVLRVPKPLKRLLQSLKGIDQVITSEDPAFPPLFPSDYHCSMMDLPYAFRSTPDTIPANVPYLFANEADLISWQKRVPQDTNVIKVGLAFAGDPHLESPELTAKDQRRSIPPELFAPLFDLPGFAFYSLQKDGARLPSSFPVIDLMGECHDFADTAAFMMQLDLIISVDTSVAHLAGALGKPVWLLNRYDTCWRWFYSREDSPWYPTMRLFRQRQSRNWTEVIQRVGEAMKSVSSRLQSKGL